MSWASQSVVMNNQQVLAPKEADTVSVYSTSNVASNSKAFDVKSC